MNAYSRVVDLVRAKFIKLGFTEVQALTYTLDIAREEARMAEEEKEMNSVVGRQGWDENYE